MPVFRAYPQRIPKFARHPRNSESVKSSRKRASRTRTTRANAHPMAVRGQNVRPSPPKHRRKCTFGDGPGRRERRTRPGAREPRFGRFAAVLLAKRALLATCRRGPAAERRTRDGITAGRGRASGRRQPPRGSKAQIWSLRGGGSRQKSTFGDVRARRTSGGSQRPRAARVRRAAARRPRSAARSPRGRCSRCGRPAWACRPRRGSRGCRADAPGR